MYSPSPTGQSTLLDIYHVYRDNLFCNQFRLNPNNFTNKLIQTAIIIVIELCWRLYSDIYLLIFVFYTVCKLFFYCRARYPIDCSHLFLRLINLYSWYHYILRRLYQQIKVITWIRIFFSCRSEIGTQRQLNMRMYYNKLQYIKC